MYPLFPLCNHLRSGSRNMIKKYGLNVSPYIVPLCMGIGCVLSKCSPVNVVVNWEYILPIRAMTSCGYPKSFIMAMSQTWLIEPKAFLKSMYNI